MQNICSKKYENLLKFNLCHISIIKFLSEMALPIFICISSV